MNASAILITVNPSGMGTDIGYIVGAIIAAIVLGYLIYALIKPEKF